MNTVNPVQFSPRNPGLNLDPGSTNSSRIAPQVTFVCCTFEKLFYRSALCNQIAEDNGSSISRTGNIVGPLVDLVVQLNEVR
jgi:hypothetical protein